jgi:hypothetical protein
MDKMVISVFNLIILWLHSIGAWVEANSDFLTAAATVAIAAFTLTLWRATVKLWKVAQDQSRDMKASIAVARESADAARKSVQVAENTLVFTQRAFVFLNGIDFIPMNDPSDYKIIRWKFVPRWENSGYTPTRNLNINVGCKVIDGELPDIFSFAYTNEQLSDGIGYPYASYNNISMMIGPKSVIFSESLDILTSNDYISAIVGGNLYLYIWGEARYNDIFSGTPDHLTRFCLKLFFIKQVGEGLCMSFTYYRDYNYAD